MKKRKPYWDMTTDELREATREFDEPFVFEKGKPLTVADKAMFSKAREHARKVKRGRPRIGKGAARITTTVERSLLERVDRYAQSHGLTRAQIISNGLTAVLAGAA
ncbi:MAG: hypothetical protein ACHRHE_07135 [Tepidisphaerales bacterium]